MKRMSAITMAIILTITLMACSTTNPIHTTTEVITEPVTANVPDTLPFSPDIPTAPPAAPEPTNLEGTDPSEPSQPKPTEPPATFDPPEQDTPEATEDPTTPSINPTEPQPTQPKPTPSEPETTEPEVTEPEVTEPPATEETICKPWCVLGEFTTILEPTTTSTGLEVAYCKNCGKEFFNEIPRLISPEKFENVDPRITIRKNIADSTVSYIYKDLCVVDTRAWGGAPIMVITEDDYLDITYYKQDGTMVSYTLRPFEGYVNRLVILDNGSFATQLIGDFND